MPRQARNAESSRLATANSGSPASAPWAMAGGTRRTTRWQSCTSGSNRLLADAEFLNDLFVALGIGLSEVVEQAATLADHHEEASPGGMVLLMRLEMLRQFTN